MKTLVLGIAVAAAGVGIAIAKRAETEGARSINEYPAGCIIASAVAPGYLPRAGLAVENRLDRPIRVWLEGRPGSGLTRTDFDLIDALENRIFAHALPVGRNVLTADDGSGQTYRQVFFVYNHAAGTCRRRYLWRIG